MWGVRVSPGWQRHSSRQVSVYNNTITNTCREDVGNQLQPLVPEFKRDILLLAWKYHVCVCAREGECSPLFLDVSADTSPYWLLQLLVGNRTWLVSWSPTNMDFFFLLSRRFSYLYTFCNGYLQTNVHSVRFLCSYAACPFWKLFNFLYSEQSFNTLKNNVVLFAFVLEYL